MYKTKIYIYFLFFGLLFTSCGRISEISIGEIEEIKIRGFEENALLVEMTVPINNPSIYKITITEIDARIFLNKNYLGRVASVDPIILHGNSNKSYTLLFTVRMANFLGAAFTVMNLKSGQKIDVKAEGTVTAKSALMKRTMEFSEKKSLIL